MIKQQQIVMANFCTFFQHEKRELLLNIHGKNSSGLVVKGIFQENQLKDKYVTNKKEKV